MFSLYLLIRAEECKGVEVDEWRQEECELWSGRRWVQILELC